MGIEFGAFLQRSDYLDVVVNHEPFMLETSRRFESHHVLRHHGASLEPACQFDGNATSSSSKGIGSMTSTRRVTAAPVGTGTPFRFDVATIDETTESSGPRAAPAVTSHTQAVAHYEVPATGTCPEPAH